MSIYYIFIIICIIIIIFNSNVDYYTNNKRCDYDHLILNKNELKDTHELLLEFLSFSDAKSIDYFAIAGTLIGTIRQGGLMPLDDDIDFGILEKDAHFFEKYNSETYEIKPVIFGYKLSKKIRKTHRKYVVLDIFVFKLKDNKYKIQNNQFHNESFETDEIFPLLISKYNNINIKVPNEYKKYLDRSFPEWDTKMKLQCDHLDNQCTYKNILKLNDEYPVDEDNIYMCHSLFE